ncbi:unnamed protein product, partial [Discosporangium mesarthrocarpum]
LPSLSHTFLNSNEAGSFGGGLACGGCFLGTLENVTFISNSAAWMGGGMALAGRGEGGYVGDPAQLDSMTRSIFIENKAAMPNDLLAEPP